MTTKYIKSFFTRINPWKFGEKKFKIDKVIQRLLKVTTPTEYKKYMVSFQQKLNYFVNFDFFYETFRDWPLRKMH